MHEIQKKYKKEIEEIVEVCHRAGELAYGASAAGNVSYRVEENLVLITPTQTPKRKMKFEYICAVDLKGNTVFAPEGKKPTGEAFMHLHIMEKRPDVKAVMHAHAPLLVGMSLSKEGRAAMMQPLIPEAMMQLGPIITVPYADPNTPALGYVFDPYINDANGFIMESHGALACSCGSVLDTIESIQIMESMAKSILTAKIFGSKLKCITREDMDGIDRIMKDLKIKMPGAVGRYNSIKEAFDYGN